MNKKILSISNSISHKQGYLDHCALEIIDFLGKIKKILFVPYALFDRDKYEIIAKERFAKINIKLESVHNSTKPKKAVENASAIFIGGGNTFRLLNELYKNDLLEIIRKKVLAGKLLYIGASAGSNVACPTIKTTNDMPIVKPPSFDSLNLIPFQINPHYFDPDPLSRHMGETRTQRIKEFHEENSQTVVGLRENSWLRIEKDKIKLGGSTGAKIFICSKISYEVNNTSNVNLLLKN